MCQALSLLALLSTTVQILTPQEPRAQELLMEGGTYVTLICMRLYLLHYYKSTNTDACEKPRAQELLMEGGTYVTLVGPERHGGEYTPNAQVCGRMRMLT
jgi:hypothetical protein